jgi:heat shock protein HtpX
MGEAYGLQTHIWNNNGKTVLLMAGFPVLLLLLTYALFLLFAGLSGATAGSGGTAGYFVWAAQALAQAWPFAIAGAILWFGIAYAFYQNIIDAATGAKPVERKDEPKLYNLLENLCISRGITMPALRIIETEGLNAFATGLHKGNYSVTVTRGLMNALTDEELEAVLAHELTHIRNADVRLLIIAVIFVGIFSFVGEMAFRGLRFGSYGGGSRRSSSRDSGGGAIIAIVVAIAIIAIAYALAIVIRFALSRRREYLADAGAVELTKNPDAMISALQKISGNSAVNAPSEVREMFIENPHSDFASIFATHPPIEKRIEVLAKYAGGRITAPVAAPAEAASRPQYRKGPWG